MKLTLTALSIAGALLTTPAAAAAADLALAFTEIGTPKGSIMVALFDSPEAYDGGKPARTAKVEATGKEVRSVIADLAPGRYAIKLFHDVDGDGKMKTNPFGIPSEPFAFSNNAAARFGPAKWAEAAFDVPPEGAAQTITIR